MAPGPVTITCALCPEWPGATGSPEEAREIALAHRKEHHPETFRTIPKPKRHYLSRHLTREREEEIEEERRVRLRQLGIE